ncbi:MAG: MlaE family lipid ABC transporter permease subunit [Nitrospirae bacterium]|nr:MAG: MlaE family lipid ABC transporter permease subunit [Nitrospirota bacterium]
MEHTDATLTNGTPASLDRLDDQTLSCGGAWTLSCLDGIERRLASLRRPEAAAVVCDATRITAMDVSGAWLLRHTVNSLATEGRTVELRGLRPEFAQLLQIVSTTATSLAPAEGGGAASWLERLGLRAWREAADSVKALAFFGESSAALGQWLAGPRLIRWRALIRSLELDGFNALPIVGLLSFLMGVVIAYQGAEQLRTFGGNIFIVDLVGIALLREIAPLVTAILVAGRSGSAYAAQLGTMKVTEELDAIRTLGLSPMELLVLPKVLALVLALPLLTVYADAVGVFGGMLIASSQLHVNFTEFLTRFEDAVALRHFLIGVGKAPVFAVIIALVGCYQGFQIRGGVDDVGRRTTVSVVQAIFMVIVVDAFFSVALSWLNL